MFKKIINLSKIVSGYIVYKKIRKKNPKSTIIPYFFDHIGDTCFISAFLNNYIATCKTQVVLVVGKKIKDVINRYDFKNIYFVSRNQLICLLYLLAYKKFILDDIKQGKILDTYAWNYSNKNDNKRFFLDILKNDIFKLNNNSSITYPRINKVHIDNSIYENSIILNEFSRSEKMNKSVLELVAKELISKGYNVYSNVLPRQKEIKETKRLICGIDELLEISKYTKAIISIRSGILDFIVPYAKKIIALYNNESQLNMYTLKQWANSDNNNIYEIIMKDSKCLVEEILKIIEKNDN